MRKKFGVFFLIITLSAYSIPSNILYSESCDRPSMCGTADPITDPGTGTGTGTGEITTIPTTDIDSIMPRDFDLNSYFVPSDPSIDPSLDAMNQLMQGVAPDFEGVPPEEFSSINSLMSSRPEAIHFEELNEGTILAGKTTSNIQPTVSAPGYTQQQPQINEPRGPTVQSSGGSAPIPPLAGKLSTNPDQDLNTAFSQAFLKTDVLANIQKKIAPCNSGGDCLVDYYMAEMEQEFRRQEYREELKLYASKETSADKESSSEQNSVNDKNADSTLVSVNHESHQDSFGSNSINKNGNGIPEMPLVVTQMENTVIDNRVVNFNNSIDSTVQTTVNPNSAVVGVGEFWWEYITHFYGVDGKNDFQQTFLDSMNPLIPALIINGMADSFIDVNSDNNPTVPPIGEKSENWGENNSGEGNSTKMTMNPLMPIAVLADVITSQLTDFEHGGVPTLFVPQMNSNTTAQVNANVLPPTKGNGVSALNPPVPVFNSLPQPGGNQLNQAINEVLRKNFSGQPSSSENSSNNDQKTVSSESPTSKSNGSTQNNGLNAESDSGNMNKKNPTNKHSRDLEEQRHRHHSDELKRSKEAKELLHDLIIQGILPPEPHIITDVIVKEGKVLVYIPSNSLPTNLSRVTPEPVMVMPGQMARTATSEGKDTISLKKKLVDLPPSSEYERKEVLPLDRPNFHGGIVKNVVGDVTKMLPWELKTSAVNAGDEIPEKTSLHTGKGAFIEIALYNHEKYIGTIKLDENTHVLLAQLEKEGPREITRLVDALGKLTTDVEKMDEGSEFSVETPTATATVRGTVFSVIVSLTE